MNVTSNSSGGTYASNTSYCSSSESESDATSNKKTSPTKGQFLRTHLKNAIQKLHELRTQRDIEAEDPELHLQRLENNNLLHRKSLQKLLEAIKDLESQNVR